MDDGRGDGRVDATGERADDMRVGADAAGDRLLLGVDHALHRPVAGEAGDAGEEAAEGGRAALAMHDLWVVLHAEQPPGRVLDGHHDVLHACAQVQTGAIRSSAAETACVHVHARTGGGAAACRIVREESGENERQGSARRGEDGGRGVRGAGGLRCAVKGASCVGVRLTATAVRVGCCRVLCAAAGVCPRGGVCCLA